MTRSPTDHSNKWFAMATVAAGVFLSTIDGSIVLVALPTLVRRLGTDFATVQWVVLAYLLAVSALLIGMGRLADMVGKRGIYTSGFVVFTLGSLLCGLAPTIGWLIGFRVVQAVGAAMILALGAAIVTEAFPASERGKALGIIGAILSVGIVLGPTLGGMIIHVLSWRWIFYVNLPVGTIGALMSYAFVPRGRPARDQRFDIVGALLLTAGVLCTLLALTAGQRSGPMAGSAALLAAGVLLIGAFVVVELRVDQPMIDLRLFADSRLSVSLVMGFLTFVAISGAVLLMPFYLENVLGFRPLQVGLLLAVIPVGLGVTSPISGALSDRLGPDPLTLAGLGTLVLGYAALTTLSAETTAAGYVLRYVPIGIGMGLFQSPNNSAIMGTASSDRLGVVSGLLAITRTLGQTTGTAVLGALWATAALALAGVHVQGGAQSAPVESQVEALNLTFYAITCLVAAALLLGLWRQVRERRRAARKVVTKL